jgi:hypothetical protein
MWRGEQQHGCLNEVNAVLLGRYYRRGMNG